jgi:hypothetical protein
VWFCRWWVNVNNNILHGLPEYQKKITHKLWIISSLNLCRYWLSSSTGVSNANFIDNKKLSGLFDYHVKNIFPIQLNVLSVTFINIEIIHALFIQNVFTMALPPIFGPCPPLYWGSLIRHMVGLLWTGDQPVGEDSTYTGKHHINTRDKHTCPQRDSKPRSQKPSGRDPRLRPRGHRDRPPKWVTSIKLFSAACFKPYKFIFMHDLAWLNHVMLSNYIKATLSE